MTKYCQQLFYVKETGLSLAKWHHFKILTIYRRKHGGNFQETRSCIGMTLSKWIVEKQLKNDYKIEFWIHMKMHAIMPLRISQYVTVKIFYTVIVLFFKILYNVFIKKTHKTEEWRFV